jgi:hypothetical protein
MHDKYLSLPFEILSGLSEGFLLCPLLFNIFITNFCHVIKHSKYLLFAEDFKILHIVTSIVLFNLTLEKIIHNLTVNPRGSIFNRTRQYVAYAYDAVTIGRSKQVNSEVIQEMGNK